MEALKALCKIHRQWAFKDWITLYWVEILDQSMHFSNVVWIGLNLGPLHTRDWEHVTITCQALSLVEKMEPVQVRFTPCSWDQHNIWMQNGCKVYMRFLRGIKWIMFHGHLDCFQKPPLRSRPNTKLGVYGTPNAYNGWFILFYHVWEPTWIKNGLKPIEAKNTRAMAGGTPLQNLLK
jgi:hypothetical protein